MDVYRGFEVVESRKGDFAVGDTAYVRWSDGFCWRNADGDPEFVGHSEAPLAPSESCVLFLNHSLGGRLPDLDAGVLVWRTAEGLVAARADSNGRLSFQTNRSYQNALGDMGLKPVPGRPLN